MRTIVLILIGIAASAGGCSGLQSPLSFNSTPPVFYEQKTADLRSNFIGTSSDAYWSVETIRPKNVKVINDLFFVDDNNGWLVGAFGTIYKTSSAGRDWKQINVELPEKTSISKLYFSDVNVGWLVCAKYNLSIIDNQKFQFWIMKTTDGGETWKITYTKIASAVQGVNFFGRDIGYVSGTSFFDSTPIEYKRFLLRTTDGGDTWVDISDPFNRFNKVDDGDWYALDNTPELFFISDRKHVLTVTSSRKILESDDGGESWSKVAQYLHNVDQFEVINLGYKIDGSEWLLESTYSIEGIWARLKIRNQDEFISRSISGVHFNSAFYLGDNRFVAAGTQASRFPEKEEAAIIWNTEDDGVTWSEVYHDKEQKRINSMVKVGNSSFWALCQDASLLHVKTKLNHL